MSDGQQDGMAGLQPGTDVHDRDGERMGAIVEVSQDYLVIEKGLFFPKDYFVPLSAVATAAPERVTLTVSRDEALEQGWDQKPNDRSGTPVDDGAAPEDEHARREGDPVTSGMGALLGTIPPAADFDTLGVAAVDVDDDYTDRGQPEGAADPAPEDASDSVGRPS